MKKYLIRIINEVLKAKAPMRDYLTAINETYIIHIGAIIYAKLL